MIAAARRRMGRPALTLAEVAVSTAIVGVIIVASLESVGMVLRTRRLNASPLSGPGLAQELLDEILAMPYEDPQNPGGAIGVDSGESTSNRSHFDDIDDYHLWSSNDAKARSGATLSGYAGWECEVEVVRAPLADPAASSSSDTGLKRISVTVTSPEGVTTTMTALRARHGAMEQKPAANTVAVSWLGAELQTGSATRVERWGARPSNHAGDAD